MGELTSGSVSLKVFTDMKTRYDNWIKLPENKGKLPSKIYTVKGGTNYVSLKEFDSMVGRYDQFVIANKRKPEEIHIIEVTTKVCNVSTTFMMQPNNWTCGVTCIRMIASRHGLKPTYQWVVNHTMANSNNGTGHIGFRQTLHDLGFKSQVSVYRKDYSWSKIKQLIGQGYDVAVNLMTGGLGGWSGNWAHWVLVQCVDDNYVWINDPDKGAKIRHDISTMNSCMDHNPNPDFIIAKK